MNPNNANNPAVNSANQNNILPDIIRQQQNLNQQNQNSLPDYVNNLLLNVAATIRNNPNETFNPTIPQTNTNNNDFMKQSSHLVDHQPLPNIIQSTKIEDAELALHQMLHQSQNPTLQNPQATIPSNTVNYSNIARQAPMGMSLPPNNSSIQQNPQDALIQQNQRMEELYNLLREEEEEQKQQQQQQHQVSLPLVHPNNVTLNPQAHVVMQQHNPNQPTTLPPHHQNQLQRNTTNPNIIPQQTNPNAFYFGDVTEYEGADEEATDFLQGTNTQDPYFLGQLPTQMQGNERRFATKAKKPSPPTTMIFHTNQNVNGNAMNNAINNAMNQQQNVILGPATSNPNNVMMHHIPNVLNTNPPVMTQNVVGTENPPPETNEQLIQEITEDQLMHCHCCGRSNLEVSFKKNYSIHEGNIESYRATFPQNSHIIGLGSVCATCYNKQWRFQRGLYDPSKARRANPREGLKNPPKLKQLKDEEDGGNVTSPISTSSAPNWSKQGGSNSQPGTPTSNTSSQKKRKRKQSTSSLTSTPKEDTIGNQTDLTNATTSSENENILLSLTPEAILKKKSKQLASVKALVPGLIEKKPKTPNELSLIVQYFQNQLDLNSQQHPFYSTAIKLLINDQNQNYDIIFKTFTERLQQKINNEQFIIRSMKVRATDRFGEVVLVDLDDFYFQEMNLKDGDSIRAIIDLTN
ncbi:hypothetical protein ABK040_013775 [Willaertia magna]